MPRPARPLAANKSDSNGKMPEKGAPVPRAQAVYKALRRAIIEQALKPGVKLPEDAIGEQLGVSRTLVREAFGRLAVEGLVELKPNRGANVAYPTLEEARDVFDVRRGLERLVAENLAGRLTAAQAAELEAHVRLEEKAHGQDGPESIRLSGEFHIRLAEMTGNALLLRYVQEASSRCSLILAIYGRPHSSECAVSEHRQLIEALRAGDAARAAALMDHHLQSVVTRALLAPRAERDIRDVLAPYALSEGLTPS
ncbi:DNA-binding transcriptional regulator, GntR family [Bosea sp. 62]|nr:DNA-binding transcriptional regulator, GntR family [Bosea sp. 46]CAD5257965.1 DNA-binding transcriptional regulator, GntR family [Bosea sp. 21B]CAD5282905.1 DNA-binding transcriptional regulator, GntR family [Bosea sp. 7B]VVT52106.1 DNA-binding transcriptional regulator, GntR family [Bosea sp. EC-HK365B]VXB38975.1 DNA-binding transcriptional regulator, GntR family [Bosea sp. 29B]VXB82411.1 DNA-binding transcriptional regulator, GntR family [Bosea sp. 125]VXC58362.1 DNA-binding transcriptio